MEIYKYCDNFITIGTKWTIFGRTQSLAPPIAKYHKNFEFCNPRWPPAATLESAKNSITPKPFVRFLRNLNWSFVLAAGTTETNLASKMKLYKIQDGRRAPMEIYNYYVNNVKTVCPKWTKFGRNHPYSISPLGKYEKSTQRGFSLSIPELLVK